MKLKRLAAGLLVGAMLLTGVPADKTGGFGLTQAYADEISAAGESEEFFAWENIAKQKQIEASSVKTDEPDGVAAAAVDGDTDTAWISGAFDDRRMPQQTLTIDLQELRSNAEQIRVTFGSEVWAAGYEVYTSDTQREDSWTLVKTRSASDLSGNHTAADSFDRNRIDEKIVLRRFVQFRFLAPTVPAGYTAPELSVAEIEIFGVPSVLIKGPTVKVTAPVTGDLPKAAEVLADEVNAAQHETLADRATPAATLIKKGSGEQGTENRTLSDGSKTDAPVYRNTEAHPWEKPELARSTEDPAVTGANKYTFGFSTLAQTPGTQNKFDVYGNDMKIISFQLYVKKLPAEGSYADENPKSVSLFGKGNKYAVQLEHSKLKVFMNGTSANNTNTGASAWPQQGCSFDPADFVNKWHDVLMVIDGKGAQRLYVDGRVSETDQGNNQDAIAKENPQGGLKPFTFGYNLSDEYVTAEEPRQFTSDYGYMARFKFYTNRDTQGIINAAGTDISEAATLSREAVTAIDIADLESAFGCSTGSAEEKEVKNRKVYDFISNMIQREEPAMRITLCPYSRRTIWSKYDPNSAKKDQYGWVKWRDWSDNPAQRVFAAGGKYSATTILDADDGFLFDEAARAKVLEKAQAAAGNDVIVTAEISGKNRRLTITHYYGCSGIDDSAIPQKEDCSITELLPQSDPDTEGYDYDEITMVYDAGKAADAQQKITLVDPRAYVTRCKEHQNAAVKFSYAVTEGSDYITLTKNSEGKTVITPKKKSKLAMGYAPVTITITATMIDGNKNPINNPNTTTPITATDEIHVFIEEPSAEEREITTAPTIRTTTPAVGAYPQVPDIKMNYTGNAAETATDHHTDIEDRTTPAATLEWLTQDYIESLPKPNPDKTLTIEEPVIKNIDGVWGFNAQGQTPGTRNKFDVYGRDAKVISFKLYLEKWPERTDNLKDPKLSLFGKGNMYAVQAGWDNYKNQTPAVYKQAIIMFMEAEPASQGENSQWPQEAFYPKDPGVYSASNPDGFLKRWHDIFMVVDGKGKERLYVDGKESESRDENIQAYAVDPNPGIPFSIGYNSKDAHQKTVLWKNQIFTEEYGYLADLKFYTNKNFYDVVNGAGANLSDAQVMSEELYQKINIRDLERTAEKKANLGAIVSTMLQSENPTVEISVTPYSTKTIWKEQISEDADYTEVIPGEPFARPAEETSVKYQSVTILEAHDGFVFADSVAEGVKENFTTSLEGVLDKDQDITVKLSSDKKTLTVTANHGEAIEGTAGSVVKNRLKDKINQAKALIADTIDEDFKPGTRQALADAITEGEKYITSGGDITGAQVAKASKDLDKAIRELEKSDLGIQKGALKEKIAEAEELVGKGEPEGIPGNTWKNLTDALADAKDGLIRTGQQVSDIIKLKDDLVQAMDAVNQYVPKGPDDGQNKDKPDSTVQDGHIFNEADGTQYQVASAKEKTIIITKGVDARVIKVGPTVTINKVVYKVVGIGNKAFKGLKKAKKVIIYENVTFIGDQAFANSKKIKSVTIGKDVTKIGKKAFFKCLKLNKLTLKGNGLNNKSIGRQAFKKTSAKSKVKWGGVKGKARTKLKKAMKKQGLKVK